MADLDFHGTFGARLLVGISEGAATITAKVQFPRLGTAEGTTAITVAMPARETLYPIHLNYLGDVPKDLRWAMESAAAAWGQILAPTPAAPFEFTEDWAGYENGRLVTGPFKAGEVLEPGLHLYVADYVRSQGMWGMAGPVGASRHGWSAVPMEPMGVIG